VPPRIPLDAHRQRRDRPAHGQGHHRTSHNALDGPRMVEAITALGEKAGTSSGGLHCMSGESRRGRRNMVEEDAATRIRDREGGIDDQLCYMLLLFMLVVERFYVFSLPSSTRFSWNVGYERINNYDLSSTILCLNLRIFTFMNTTF
jgi:hypothetical protein